MPMRGLAECRIGIPSFLSGTHPEPRRTDWSLFSVAPSPRPLLRGPLLRGLFSAGLFSPLLSSAGDSSPRTSNAAGLVPHPLQDFPSPLPLSPRGEHLVL